jgi:hypothetical protein
LSNSKPGYGVAAIHFFFFVKEVPSMAYSSRSAYSDECFFFSVYISDSSPMLKSDSEFAKFMQLALTKNDNLYNAHIYGINSYYADVY